MDFIAGLANMRARNCSISGIDKLDQGKARSRKNHSCHCYIHSDVCLELYKGLDGAHALEDYRNTFANLALPLFAMAEPVPPKVIKHQDLTWTEWGRWIIRDNPTLEELLKWRKTKGLLAYSISCGSCLLYNSMLQRHKERRMGKKKVDLARDIAKAELPPYYSHFDVVVVCEDEDSEDIDIPQISIYFR